jgi:hypothetical protein
MDLSHAPSYRALCVVVLLPLWPRSSTAGRYADNFPSGLCRITLNLFFLLLNIR